jgi:heme-degrading monooxygenase HmoA
MVTVVLSHDVTNFEEWKKGFDSGESLRQQNGIKTHGVYNSVDNRNRVTVITEFPNKEAVQGFISSPNLKADMEKAGVVGAPEVKILNKI